jgi:hypothetical protein
MSHKQNDLDEPNNGARYYYVDEDEAAKKAEEDTSSETSSVSVNLRDYVDYNNPITPRQPTVTPMVPVTPAPVVFPVSPQRKVS